MVSSCLIRTDRRNGCSRCHRVTKSFATGSAVRYSRRQRTCVTAKNRAQISTPDSQTSITGETARADDAAGAGVPTAETILPPVEIDVPTGSVTISLTRSSSV